MTKRTGGQNMGRFFDRVFPGASRLCASDRPGRSEAGDTLIEILIALAVMGIVVVSMLLAFSTAIFGSTTYRNLASMDTVLRSAAEEATAAIQSHDSGSDNTTNAFFCQDSLTSLNGLFNFNLATGYSAQFTAVTPTSPIEYWSGTTTSSTCVPDESSLYVTVTVTGPNGAVSHITFIVYDPLGTPAQPCTAPTQLIFNTSPSNSIAGSPFSDQPVVWIEDKSGLDTCAGASALTLSITPGTGTSGATLSQCSASVFGGVVTFDNCLINTIGTNYTLTASDGSLPSIYSSAFNVNAGAPAQLVFTTQPGGGTGGTPWSTPNNPVVTVEDANGNPIATDNSTITLAIGSNPSSGGTGALSGCAQTGETSGVVTFSPCSINTAAAGYTLIASNGSLSAISSIFSITAGPATQLAFTTQPGNGTSGTSSSDRLLTQPKVTVEDAGGNAVTSGSTVVTLALRTVLGSGGTLTCNPASNTMTAAPSLASFGGCSVTGPGTYYLQATASGLGTANSANFTVSNGTVSKVVFSTSPSNSVSAVAFGTQPVVTLEDSNSNTVTTATSAVALAINSGSGTLSCSAVNATSGIASFSGCSITLKAPVLSSEGQFNLVATTTGVPASAPSSNFTVAGPASQLVFTIQPGGGTGGTPWSSPNQPVVTVEDANGDTVTNASAVTLAMGTNPGGGSSVLSGCSGSESAGVETFSGCSINKAANGYTLSAKYTSPSITQVSAAFNITVGPSAQLVFSASPSNSTGGTPFATQPVVTIEDVGGNVVTGDTSTVTLAIASGTPKSGGPGTLSGCTGAAPNNGVTSFSGCQIDLVGTGYQLTASDGSLISGISSTFNITAGTATQLAFTSSPGLSTAGSSFGLQPVVTIEDAGGNTVTGATSSVTLTISTNPGGGTLTCTQAANTIAAVKGVATFSGCKINRAGQGYILTATDTALPLATDSTTSGAFTVVANNPTHLVFTTSPSSSTGGVAFPTQPQVTVEDAQGNPVTNDSSAVALAVTAHTGTTGATVAGCSEIEVNGVVSFSGCSVNKAGTSYTLTATDGTLTPATSATFNITVGPAALLAFTTEPVNGTAGTPLGTQPVVTVQDAGGNTVTTDTSTVNLAIGTNPSTGSLTCNPNNSVAASGGVAAFNGCAINEAGTGYTLKATDGTLPPVTSTVFTIVPWVSNLTPTSGPVGTTGVSITANGFAANSALTVKVGGTTATIASGGTTNANGISTVTFTIPTVPHGAQSVVVTDGSGNTATSATPFTVTSSASSLNPTNGPVGTTGVTITANGFAANSALTVKVGGTTATIASGGTTNANGTSTVTFTIPAVPGGAQSVVVTDGSGNTATSATSFTVTSALSVTPTSGAVGSTAVLSGTGYTTGATVKTANVTFGSTTLTITTQTVAANGTWTASFTVPSSPHGSQNITATDSGTDSASTPFTVTSSVSGLNPTSGPVGTTGVSITANGFAANSALTVKVGGTTATIASGGTTNANGISTVTFTVPTVPGGAQSVVVTDGSGNTATSATSFTVTSVVSNLNPTSGPVGTTGVSITANGFAANSALTVKVGGTTATIASGGTTNANGISTVTFTIPTVPHGAQSVVVTDGSGNTATSATPFTVTSSASSLNPTSGPVGTTGVTITANGFAANSALTVKVGGTTATIASGGTTNANGTSTVTFTIPAVPGGAQSVVVTDGSGNTATSATSFTVTSALSVTPTSGAVGSTAVLSGTGYTTGATVKTANVTFGSTTLTITTQTVAANGTWTASFTVPSSPHGSQNITATDSGTDSASTPFTVTSSVSGLNPTNGPVGTTGVTITANGFAANSALTVKVGGTTATIASGGTTNANGISTVTFTVPTVPGGAQSVVVTDGSGNTATSATSFTVTSVVSNLNPTSGPVGTTGVSITANGFAANSALTVKVGGTTATIASGGTTNANGISTVTFTIPTAPHGAQSVVVTDGSGNTATSATPFTVTSSASNLNPTSGPVGTTGVTITANGFAANSALTVKVGGTTATIASGGTTNANGTSTVTFTIPAVPGGAQSVVVTDGSGNTATSATSFTVTSALSVTPTSGAVGSTAVLSGTGYTTGATVKTANVTFGSTTLTITTQTVAANGTWTASFTVPSSPHGSQNITATDSGTDSASTPFTVTSSVSGLNPTNGPVGTTGVTITANGFAANSALTVKVGGTTATIASGGTTNANGISTVTFTIPTVPGGAQSVVVTDGSGNTATSATSFTVTSVVSNLNPTSGPVGTTGVTITANGFAANSALTVKVGGTTATIASGGTTNANGISTVTFTIPTAPHGAQSVVVTDGSGNTATSATPFTVTSSASNLNPTSGPVGTTGVTITANGFAANSALTVKVGGTTATIASGGTTNANGTSTVTFTIPAVPGGAQSVVVTDGSGNTATSATSFVVRGTVQNNVFTCSTTTTACKATPFKNTFTLAAPTQAGDLIVVSLFEQGSNGAPTISDSAGNTYTITTEHPTGGYESTAYALDAAAASSITITTNSSTPTSLAGDRDGVCRLHGRGPFGFGVGEWRDELQLHDGNHFVRQ